MTTLSAASLAGGILLLLGAAWVKLDLSPLLSSSCSARSNGQARAAACVCVVGCKRQGVDRLGSVRRVGRLPIGQFNPSHLDTPPQRGFIHHQLLLLLQQKESNTRLLRPDPTRYAAPRNPTPHDRGIDNHADILIARVVVRGKRTGPRDVRSLAGYAGVP